MNRLTLLSLCPILILTSFCVIGVSGQVMWTIQDENLTVGITINGKDLADARSSANAIVLDPRGEVYLQMNYSVIGDNSLHVTGFSVTLVILGQDLYSYTDELDIHLSPADEGSLSRTMMLKDYLEPGNIQLVSGIYNLRISIHYETEKGKMELRSELFYVKIGGNPFLSAMGVISTLGIACAAYFVVNHVHTLRTYEKKALESVEKSSTVFPTQEMNNLIKDEYAARAQDTVFQKVMSYYRNLRNGEKCPSCKAEWPKNLPSCPKCGLARDEIEKHASSLADKCFHVGQMISSVSGIAVARIAGNLGESIDVSTDIVTLLALFGFASVEPHLGEKLPALTRKFVRTGLYITLISLIWIQVNGFETISLEALMAGTILGIIAPIIISKIYERQTQKHVYSFWKERQIQMTPNAKA